MRTYLLDANVLIALTVADHVHHDRASSWAGTVERFAVCPVVEGALVRFLVRAGERASSAQQVLRALEDRPGYDFWPDSRSYAEVNLQRVQGHRQVTDAYLVGLATGRPPAVVATLDEGLNRAHPEATVLVPDAVDPGLRVLDPWTPDSETGPDQRPREPGSPAQ